MGRSIVRKTYRFLMLEKWLYIDKIYTLWLQERVSLFFLLIYSFQFRELNVLICFLIKKVKII